MGQTNFAIFSNGLAAQFGYFKKAFVAKSAAEAEFSKRKANLAEDLYKKLVDLIKDGEIKSFLKCNTQNGKPILLDLAELHFKENKISETSNICCSNFAFENFEKNKVSNLIFKLNGANIFGDYAQILAISNSAGICFNLRLTVKK